MDFISFLQRINLTDGYRDQIKFEAIHNNHEERHFGLRLRYMSLGDIVVVFFELS